MFDTANIEAEFAFAQALPENTQKEKEEKTYRLKYLSPYGKFFHELDDNSFDVFNPDFYGQNILSLPPGLSVYSEFISQESNVIHSGFSFGTYKTLNIFMIYGDKDYSYSINLDTFRPDCQFHCVKNNAANATDLLSTLYTTSEPENPFKLHHYYDVGAIGTISEVMQKLKLMIHKLPVPMRDGYFKFDRQNIEYLQSLAFIEE